MTDTAETEQVADTAEPVFLRPPSACGTEFEQVDWVGTLNVQLEGGKHLAIRFNDRRLMDAAAKRLNGRASLADEQAPAYYSVKLNAPTRRSKTPLHYIYLGARPIVGTRDVSRLLAALAAHVGQHLELPPTDVYTTHGIAVRSPSGVLLVPSDLGLMGKVVDRVLRPAGYVIADVPFVHLDLLTAEVVVPESTLSFPLDEVSEGLPASKAEEHLSPGRYPIARWLVAVGAEDAGPLRHAQAVLHGTRSLKTPFPHGAQAAVDDVARVTKDVPVEGVTWASDEELVQAVLDAGHG